jgi:hypothetical protein
VCVCHRIRRFIKKKNPFLFFLVCFFFFTGGEDLLFSCCVCLREREREFRVCFGGLCRVRKDPSGGDEERIRSKSVKTEPTIGLNKGRIRSEESVKKIPTMVLSKLSLNFEET